MTPTSAFLPTSRADLDARGCTELDVVIVSGDAYVDHPAGNLDSMLNRLTAQKKNRSEDQYSPGGRTGCRPDRATVVYAQRCREAYPDVPVVLGGIEASLRRIAHYDYWSDTVRRSMLVDATMQPVYNATGLRAKKLQKALLLYWSPAEWPLAREALREAGRADLIGSGPDALVPAEGEGERRRVSTASSPPPRRRP